MKNYRKTKPAQVVHWALAPAEMDKLRLIGAPSSIIDTVRKYLQLYYPNGISSENPNFYSCHEFKLKGLPWYVLFRESGKLLTDRFRKFIFKFRYGRQGNDELFMHSCLLFLLKQLDKDGWKATGSLDVSAKHLRASDGPDYPIDVHTIFFQKK